MLESDRVGQHGILWLHAALRGPTRASDTWHRGDDPILTLSETPFHTVFLPLARFTFCALEGENLRCVLQMSEFQCRLGWFYRSLISPST